MQGEQTGLAKTVEEERSKQLATKVQTAEAEMTELKKIIGEGVADIRYSSARPLATLVET